MIAAPLVGLALLGALEPSVLDCEVDVDLDLEYSTYLDVFRRIQEPDSRVSAVGPRVGLTLRQGALALAAAGTVFPGRALAASLDLSASYFRRWRMIELLIGGGAGAFYTGRDTMIPTTTDTYSGPSIHAALRLRWRLFRGWHASLGGSVHLYPTQRLLILPVGLDLRWLLGLGATL